MAGPCTGVLLPSQLTEDQRGFVSNLIDEISDEVEGDDFRVATTHPLGGTYCGKGRPFAIEWTDPAPGVPNAEYLPDETRLIQREFWFEPRQSVSLIAMCSGDEDHRILGELVCAVAERFGGVIDFDGMLSIDESEHAGLTAIPYDCETHTAYCHYGTAEFMRYWLSHDRFRMIK